MTRQGRILWRKLMSKIAMIFAGAALYSALTVTTVTAAPIAPVSANAVVNVEQVGWVCGPHGRCWWRPNYYWHHRYWHRHYW